MRSPPPATMDTVAGGGCRLPENLKLTGKYNLIINHRGKHDTQRYIHTYTIYKSDHRVLTPTATGHRGHGGSGQGVAGDRVHRVLNMIGLVHVLMLFLRHFMLSISLGIFQVVFLFFRRMETTAGHPFPWWKVVVVEYIAHRLKIA